MESGQGPPIEFRNFPLKSFMVTRVIEHLNQN